VFFDFFHTPGFDRNSPDSQLAEQYGKTWSGSGRERSDSDLSLKVNDHHHGGSFESKMARHNPMYI